MVILPILYPDGLSGDDPGWNRSAPRDYLAMEL
jgi:hypothetical protein